MKLVLSTVTLIAVGLVQRCVLANQEVLECSEGFFRSGKPKQCFKLFNEVDRDFDEGKAKCEAENMRLAEPQDPIAVRSYLLNKIPDVGFWAIIGARGNGASLEWVYGVNEETVSPDSPYWYPRNPGRKVKSSHCLVLLTNWQRRDKFPSKPYASQLCSEKKNILCEAVCPGGCGHGLCSSANQCTCEETYTGSNCSTPVCPDGCVHGQCTAPSECTCKEGYVGSNCSTPVCPGGCGHGQCTAPSQCTCEEGYAGSNCSTPVCPDGCGDGQCTAPGQCTDTGSDFSTQCPESFFSTEDSNQCFKLFDDVDRNFTEGKAKCEAENLRLAEPQDPVALRTYLNKNYGEGRRRWTILGARGNGSSIAWQYGNNVETLSGSPYWYKGNPGNNVTSSYCLFLKANYGRPHLTTPYYSMPCSNKKRILCEQVN